MLGAPRTGIVLVTALLFAPALVGFARRAAGLRCRPRSPARRGRGRISSDHRSRAAGRADLRLCVRLAGGAARGSGDRAFLADRFAEPRRGLALSVERRARPAALGAAAPCGARLRRDLAVDPPRGRRRASTGAAGGRLSLLRGQQHRASWAPRLGYGDCGGNCCVCCRRRRHAVLVRATAALPAECAGCGGAVAHLCRRRPAPAGHGQDNGRGGERCEKPIPLGAQRRFAQPGCGRSHGRVPRSTARCSMPSSGT